MEYMGYETHFRLKGELDSEFKSWMREPNKDTNMYKIILESICMKKYDNSDCTSFHKAYKDISTAVWMYVGVLEQDWKYALEKELKENNNETYFCGWEHARNDFTWENEEDVKDYFTEQLFMIAMEPCDDRFDTKDHNTYFNKLEEVGDLINDIEDCVRSAMDAKFINRYRGSEDADESDGYDHRYPEEEDEDEDDCPKEVEEVHPEAKTVSTEGLIFTGLRND